MISIHVDDLLISGDDYFYKNVVEVIRRDFDVGGSSFVMSKTVKIQVKYYQNLP